MVKVEYCGERYGCPFCSREICRNGICACGAKVKIDNLTAEAAAGGDQMTRQLADSMLNKVAKVLFIFRGRCLSLEAVRGSLISSRTATSTE